MKTKLFALTILTLTFGVIAYYPSVNALNHGTPIEVNKVPINPVHSTALHNMGNRPVVDVVFVLDTTGSMSGLIETARQKIWSIAKTMASAQPTPQIRIGLVGYRDRGDTYVTKRVDLSSDLDSVYAALMDFQADGGGDGPESVNQALDEAVHRMSWSQSNQAYQVIFLVGDAPPHMDYPDEVQFPAILSAAANLGIVVNTIQCGDLAETTPSWTQIAELGNGSFFAVEQAGSAVVMASPYDEEIATLAAKLDDTRLYYGSAEEKEQMSAKVDAAKKLQEGASTISLASRGAFNSAAGGAENFLGEKELVDAVVSGEVSLDELDRDQLPEAIKPMAPAAQVAYIRELAKERNELQGRVRELSEARSDFLKQKVEEAGGAKDSLDQKIYDTVSRQAKVAGLEYTDGPEY